MEAEAACNNPVSVDSKLSIQPLQAGTRAAPQFFPWCLVGVEQLLSKRFLPYKLESFLVFWLQKSFQVFVFPFCSFWHSWVAIYSVPSLRCMKQK